ncbi:hypothetical protein [Streptacidiphilus albus]|uniref:hypothetical protein n=1 Tax=Streptacidiphilus albus TaxID=105425 RepID=UPI000B0391F4|nr:hypothetical protein [Streptacidiphilus albus]
MSRLTFDAAIGFDNQLRDNPKWQDVTRRVQGFTTNRGRTFQMDNIEAGTASITLNNFDGNLTPGSATLPVNANQAGLYPTHFMEGAVLPADLVNCSGGTYSTIAAPNLVNTLGIQVTVSASNPLDQFIISFPKVPVVEGTRLVQTTTATLTTSTNNPLSVAYCWFLYGPDGTYLNYVSDTYTYPITTTTPGTTFIGELIVPPNVGYVLPALIDRTGSTATTLSLTSVQLLGFVDYADYIPSPSLVSSQPGSWWAGIISTVTNTMVSQVTPNKRVRITSIVGGNLWPAWIASPQGGREANYAWDTSSFYPGINGLWQYNFNASPINLPPGSNYGVTPTSFRISTVTGKSGTLGSAAIKTNYGIYCGRQYRMSFLIRNDSTGPNPVAGNVQLSIYDPNSPQVPWSYSTIPIAWTATSTVPGWQTVTQTIMVPTGYVNPQVQLNFNFGPTTQLATTSASMAFEIMGLQLQEIGTPWDSDPTYMYGDGAEPIFTGYTDKWSAMNDSPFGNANTTTLDCSDDLRVCGDTQLYTPYQATTLRNQGTVVYLPLNDGSANDTTSEVAGGMTGGQPAFIRGQTATVWDCFQAAGSIVGNGAIEGNNLAFSAPTGAETGTCISVTCPALNGNIANGSCTQLTTQGFSADFWFEVTAAQRPANGAYYDVISQANASGRAGLRVTLYGDANGDYVMCSWGGNPLQGNISFARGALFNGKPHYVSVAAAPINSNGTRTITIVVDAGSGNGVYFSWNASAPTASGFPATNTYIGGYRNPSNNGVETQFVGVLAHVAFYSNSIQDSTTTDVAGRWTFGGNWQTAIQGTALMQYACGWVNTEYQAFINAASGYTMYSPDFSNTNALTFLQDTAADLEASFYFTKWGLPAFVPKSVMDQLWLGNANNDDIQYTSWAWGMGSEPGYAFESDIADIYTVARGTQNSSLSPGNAYAAFAPQTRQQYGYRETTFDTALNVPNDIQTRCQTLISRYSAPRTRITDPTWALTANDYLVESILRLDLLSLLQVQSWPADAPWSTATFIVQRIQHDVQVAGNQCEWNTTTSLQRVS